MITELRMICSPWLGEIEWDPQCELSFPLGLPGFEGERKMIPVEIPAHRPLVYLQSLTSGETCFLCLPILAINPGFHLRLSDDERSALLLTDDCEPVIGVDVLCLALLVPSGTTVQANLKAPIVINLHNYRGLQSVAADQSSACFRLEESGQWEALC
jgi:flagellar assembly factor FliW